MTYAAFSLGAPSGFRLAALPPFQVASRNASAVAQPAFVSGGFLVAPWHARFYPWLGVWSGPPAFDAPYYDQWYGAWPAVPDDDVLREALPEGVLEPGGHAQGFLYFRDEKPGAAVEFLGSALSSGIIMTKPEALLDYGDILFQAGSYDAALNAVNSFVERFGDNQRSRLLRIKVLIAGVRAQRMAHVDGRFIPGLKAVAAPVTNWQGEAEVAVTADGRAALKGLHIE